MKNFNNENNNNILDKIFTDLSKKIEKNSNKNNNLIMKIMQNKAESFSFNPKENLTFTRIKENEILSKCKTCPKFRTALTLKCKKINTKINIKSMIRNKKKLFIL